MTENPYQSTLTEIDEPIVESRPVSIDIQTAATFFAVAVPLSIIAYCGVRWFSYALRSPKLVLGIAVGAAATMGYFAAWRTWNRLLQFHVQQVQLRKKHEETFAVHRQRKGSSGS